MVSTQKPIFAVVGATGYQGKSVVAEAYKTGKYHIRALTRNPKSEGAQKLLAEYPEIELVTANNNDYKSLLAAFTGATYAFFFTNFWDPAEKLDPLTDLRQGKLQADAAKEAGVKFVIWSSLPDVEGISKGTIDVPFFSNKAKVEKYLESIGQDHAVIYAGWYASNWDRWGIGPTREKDGSLSVQFPFRADVALPVIDTEADFGKYVVKILENPKEYSGKCILAFAEYQTYYQIAKDYARVTGEPVKIVQVPLDSVTSKEVREMYRWFNDYGCFNGEHIDNDAFFGRDKPKLNNFGGWLERTGFRVPK